MQSTNGSHMVFVYMLRCSDGAYYVGSTRASLEQRIAQHNAGTFGGFTAHRRPVELVWHESFERITDAIAVERQLKGWTRVKKEALIARAYEPLPELSGSAWRRGMSFDTPTGAKRRLATQDEG